MATTPNTRSNSADSGKPKRSQKTKTTVATKSTSKTRAQLHREKEIREKRQRQAKFIKELAARGVVTQSAIAVGIDRVTAYKWRDEEGPEGDKFRQAWLDALDQATDLLEAEAIRRGAIGVEKPLVVGGRLVSKEAITGDPKDADKIATIREYSDNLLATMLKANRPAKFKDKVEVTGHGGGPVKVEHTFQSVDEVNAALAGLDAEYERLCSSKSEREGVPPQS